MALARLGPSPLPQSRPTADVPATAARAPAAVTPSQPPQVADTPATARARASAFYEAFGKGDAAGMAASYAPNVVFHDPLFGHLTGGQVMEMWNTILPAANPQTFKLSSQVVGEPVQLRDGSFQVKVHWDASYDLTALHAHVDNHSDTTLVIKNGKILSQRDEWDLSKWTKQALPLGGGSAVANALVRLGAHGAIEVADFLKVFGAHR